MSTIEFQQQLVGLRQQLFFFALSLTKDRDNALDLVQESLARALLYRDKFRDNTNFKAWLYTIVKNHFINGHRRNKRTLALMENMGHGSVGASSAHAATGTDGRIQMAEIERSLERLAPTFRTPFIMHHEGYKYNEIAAQLAIPIGTVKSRIFEARSRLKRMLTDTTTTH